MKLNIFYSLIIQGKNSNPRLLLSKYFFKPDKFGKYSNVTYVDSLDKHEKKRICDFVTENWIRNFTSSFWEKTWQSFSFINANLKLQYRRYKVIPVSFISSTYIHTYIHWNKQQCYLNLKLAILFMSSVIINGRWGMYCIISFSLSAKFFMN